MAEVVLDKICKSFGGKFHVIKDLSLTVRDGEFLILVGPSGCGQIHGPSHDRRAGGHHQRHAEHRRRKR